MADVESPPAGELEIGVFEIGGLETGAAIEGATLEGIGAVGRGPGAVVGGSTDVVPLSVVGEVAGLGVAALPTPGFCSSNGRRTSNSRAGAGGLPGGMAAE